MKGSPRRSVGGTLVLGVALLALGACGPPRAKRTAAPRDSLAGPHFAFGKSDLAPEGRAKVRIVAATLNKYPNRRVAVTGYTDVNGSDEHNEDLSLRRAEAVKQALVEDGVAERRIVVRGYGASNPVASNATAEGRAQNRRVEIVLE